ncbi:histidine phosphatase family protein [Cellulomonas rhizosphaerae]|uniref:Histidine phosphatase family protein n=1 Tax=Cellulomonas rhizosphaerae TaxID=2293719 RepID=A0A413RR87_9CELL|nr:histidine phosphatase family protein [Cellulomonas rhizosphaerae]RHA44448.1 histidine phosphatase family protein [Cellulomonas rhizosphaerae]
MTAGRLLLWRHGRTAFNAEARLQGQVDIPLDDVGRWQARTAAARMLERHEPTHIIASDLVRADETARFLARAAGLEVVPDVRVRERAFGEWEGLTGDEIQASWPEDFALWRAGGEPQRVGAETRAQVAARMAAAIAEQAAALGKGDTLVVVSHGAAISSAVGELLGMAPEWRGIVGMLNAHWAELISSTADGQASWRLTGYNLGPTDASSDWNAGPDTAHGSEADAPTRDPD